MNRIDYDIEIKQETLRFKGILHKERIWTIKECEDSRMKYSDRASALYKSDNKVAWYNSIAHILI